MFLIINLILLNIRLDSTMYNNSVLVLKLISEVYNYLFSAKNQICLSTLLNGINQSKRLLK